MPKKVILLLLLLFSAACSVVQKELPTEDVDKATALFLERLANAQYDKIYSESAKSFKEENPQTQVLETLKQMAELGKPVNPNRINMRFETAAGKRVAIPTYYVYFNDQRMTLVCKFIEEENQWKLGGYEVRQRAG